MGCDLVGHITSNIVEGEKGFIAQMRKNHPLKFVDAYMLRHQDINTSHWTAIFGLLEKGDKLTPFAKDCRGEKFTCYAHTRSADRLWYTVRGT